MRTWRVAAALVVLVATGCDRTGAAQGNDTIYYISGEDAEMNAAKQRAISSLPSFYARLANPSADETEFMVKFDIVPDDEHEFVWATDLDRTSTPMTGVLVNQPRLTEHQIGQRVPIPEVDIIDWSYRKGRIVQGSFTTRVLLRDATPEDAAEMRNYLGW